MEKLAVLFFISIILIVIGLILLGIAIANFGAIALIYGFAVIGILYLSSLIFG